MQVYQLRKLEYVHKGQTVTIDIISKASHKWTRIADLITTEHNVVDNLRDEYRGKNEEAFRKLMVEHFVEKKPPRYSQDWSGLIDLLNDAGLGSIALDIEKAFTQ